MVTRLDKMSKNLPKVQFLSIFDKQIYIEKLEAKHQNSNSTIAQ